jgi:serine protease AprX
MMIKSIIRPLGTNLQRIVSLFAFLTLMVAVTPLAQARHAAPNAQPALLQFAAQHPSSRVGVIVQKLAKNDSVEQLVTELGGVVTKDLHIINAFAADVPTSAIVTLSSASGVHWVSLDSPTHQSLTSAVFTTWATTLGTSLPMSFTNSAALVDSPLGANRTFSYGDIVKGAFGGFISESTPGTHITKIELVVVAYVPVKLGSGEDPIVTAVVNGMTSSARAINHSDLNPYISAATAGTIYLDITDRFAWKWSDFENGLEVRLDQSKVKSGHPIYYDAIGLRVTSGAGTDTSGIKIPTSLPATALSTTNLTNVYNTVVRATDVWNQSPKYLQGQGVTVAVVDSGFVKNKDIGQRFLGSVNFNAAYHDSNDRYGHGSFVGGIVADDGTDSKGARIGIAPKTNIINVRVSDDQGMATVSDVVNALQWVNDNRTTYNIRVVNLSLNSAVAQSYNVDPLCAAVEILWFNKVVVTVSAGNNGSATLYPPANDPFVITVGATNDMGTPTLSDDIVAPYSAYGTTLDGYAKPDLVAPGTNIVGYLPGNDKLIVGKQHVANRLDNNYFRMSGTSMAAPMVAGAAALLLQDEPSLTPDQVKYRFMATAVNSTTAWPDYAVDKAGAGYLDIYAAVNGTTTASANTGVPISRIVSGSTTTTTWNSASWGSASWGSASWGSASWGSASWGSASWSSDYWSN